MTAISRRLPPVVVEYDRRGQRVRRHFADGYGARRFYTLKDRQGKRPKVLQAS